MAKGYIKIGNTSFQKNAIKKMTLKQFKKTYEKVLKGQDLDAVYNEVTGKKAPEPAQSTENNDGDDVG